MGEAKDRELDVILELIRLTQEGQLTWRARGPWGDLVNTENRKLESVFLCQYKDRYLRIYVERVRVDKPAGISGLINSMSISTYPPREYPYWDSRTVLEFTDSEGRTLWSFPRKPALDDLMTAVKYNVAGVKDFFDKLLADKK